MRSRSTDNETKDMKNIEWKTSCIGITTQFYIHKFPIFIGLYLLFFVWTTVSACIQMHWAENNSLCIKCLFCVNLPVRIRNSNYPPGQSNFLDHLLCHDLQSSEITGWYHLPARDHRIARQQAATAQRPRIWEPTCRRYKRGESDGEVVAA